MRPRSARSAIGPTTTWRRNLRRGTRSALVVAVASVSLFAWNGLVSAHGEHPIAGTAAGTADTEVAPVIPADTVRILAWNLAKGFVHEGGLAFASTDAVEQRMRGIAAVIRRERPDLVFLSEVVIECTPCDVDQVRFLAEATGLRHWAFGENYNFGLPFVRIVGGNAILSRFPIAAIGNPDLCGRRPFFLTRNSRRFLHCRTSISGRDVHLGAMHTDSFDLANNLRQTEQILALTAAQPTILAGDFNAEPSDASLAAVRDSGRFSGAVDGRPTYPTKSPSRRIDYVFAPVAWTLLDHRVLDDPGSDHRAVIATFRFD